MSDTSAFYQVQILDNEDPMMLGRVRARLLTDNYQDIVKSFRNPPFNEEKDKWTERDPFVFSPLMPYFMYSVPKVDEMAQIIYVNKDFKYQNQYYIQNTFSTPTATNFEYYVGGNKFTGTGTQLKTPKPLKNSDGSYTDQAVHKGVFPEPGDNALLGRGSADVVIKENEVLIRAGKFKGSTLKPNIVPVGDSKRGFLQLSRFNVTKSAKPDKILTEFTEVVVPVNYLIEWLVINPENNQNKFSGSLYLYRLKADTSTNSQNLTVGSVISEDLRVLVAKESFTALTLDETIARINEFIITCNDTDVTKTGTKLFDVNSNKFAMFYRPANLTYSYLEPSTFLGSDPTLYDAKANLTKIFVKVKLLPTVKQGGYGLIWKQNSVGTPTNITQKKIPQSAYSPNPVTYGALASDVLYLLSQNSEIPNKGKINFENSLYGLSAEQFVDELLPKTSSLVRGEELLELLNLIVQFLITHTHAYPGLPTVEITENQTRANTILEKMGNAYNSILNQNIRLN